MYTNAVFAIFSVRVIVQVIALVGSQTGQLITSTLQKN